MKATETLGRREFVKRGAQIAALARIIHGVSPAAHITLHANKLCFIPSKTRCSGRSTTTPFASSWTSLNIKFSTFRESPDDNLGYTKQSDVRRPWQFFLPHVSSAERIFLDAGVQVFPRIFHLTRVRRTVGRVRDLRHVSRTIFP